MLKNKQEYFRELLTFLKNNNLSVNIFFVTRKKESDAYDVYKGNLSDNVSNTLRSLCLRVAKKSYSKPEKREFRPYDAAVKNSNYTEYLEGKNLETIKPMLNLIETKSIDLKKIDNDFLDSLWFYVIKLSDENKEILFFKKYSKCMVLTKSFGLALTFRSGDFDKLKHDIFMISDKVDCILYSDKLIIRSKGNFEKIFNFFHLIRKNAESAIKFIKEKLPFNIENFDEVTNTWMKHEIKIRKLNNIYSTKSFERIKPENIQILIDEGILRNVTTKKDEQGKLIISSDDPWEILNILDDDYVKSRLTGIDYEAMHKKEIKK